MKFSILFTVLMITCMNLSGCGSIGENEVTPGQTVSMLRADTGVVLLDVRTPGEFEGELGHIEDAILIPVQELGERAAELEVFKGKTILAYCRTGRRSLTAAKLLREKGYNAFSVRGGMVEWNDKNLPHVVHGK